MFSVVSCFCSSEVVFSTLLVFSSTVLTILVFSLEVTASLTLSIPYLLRASNAISNTNTIAAVISTIVITAIVLLASCFGVGQITFFNSALKFLKPFLFSFLLFYFLL